MPAGPAGRVNVRRLIAMARDAQTEGRGRVILELGELAEDEPALGTLILPAFQELLGDPEPAIRGVVVQAAGEACDSRDFRERDLMATGHPVLQNLEFLSVLVQTLDDSERGVRESVPRALGKIVEYNLPAAEFIIPKVNPLMRSEQAGTRTAAAEAVRQMASRLDGAFAELSNSPSDSENATALKIARLFQSTIPNLEFLKHDEDPEARREAEKALSEIAKFSKANAAPAGQ